MKYVLQFENFLGKRKDQKEFEANSKEEAVQTAIRYIYKIQEQKDYHVFYIRSWPVGDAMKFDFGSHAEFYYLTTKD